MEIFDFDFQIDIGVVCSVTDFEHCQLSPYATVIVLNDSTGWCYPSADVLLVEEIVG